MIGNSPSLLFVLLIARLFAPIVSLLLLPAAWAMAGLPAADLIQKTPSVTKAQLMAGRQSRNYQVAREPSSRLFLGILDLLGILFSKRESATFFFGLADTAYQFYLNNN
jgi:hypothetical protein